MILGTTLGEPASGAAQPQQGGSRVTIDEIFRRVAQRRPEALALADAPNRKTFTDGAPRRLTFAQADRMVSAIAGRLAPDGAADRQPSSASNCPTSSKTFSPFSA